MRSASPRPKLQDRMTNSSGFSIAASDRCALAGTAVMFPAGMAAVIVALQITFLLRGASRRYRVKRSAAFRSPARCLNQQPVAHGPCPKDDGEAIGIGQHPPGA